MYPKNSSLPPPLKAKVVKAADGSAITAAVAAYHVTATTRTAGAGTLTHVANGLWSYAPTQAETNYSEFAVEFYHADAVAGGPVVDVVTEAVTLSSIKTKTDLLTTNTAIVNSVPLSSAGDITLVRGDDYLIALGNAIRFEAEAGEWPDLTDATLTLTVRNRTTDAIELELAGQVITGGTDAQEIAFEAPAADTAEMNVTEQAPVSLPAGLAYSITSTTSHKFDVEAQFEDSETPPNTFVRTLAMGYCAVIEDQTRPAAP